jgi:DNA polymerase-3 subunit beta
MKLEITKESLLEAISLVIGVVERRQSMPILSHLLISLSDGELSVIGTDLEVQVQVQTLIDAKTSEAGKVTLPGRKLYDICRSLPEGAILLVGEENGKTKVSSGSTKFSLSSLVASEFPLMSSEVTDNQIELDSDDFIRLLEKTSFSMANQDVRHYLNGVMLQIKNNNMYAVATDGHRLALSCHPLKEEAPTDFNIIVPRKAVIELQKILLSGKKVIIKSNKNQISVKQDQKTLTSKLIDGNFPDYERVIPPSPTNVITADRKKIKQSLQRVSILSNEKYRGIRINIDTNQILIRANNPEQEEAEESLSVGFNGDSLEVGFNVGYLIDILSVIEQDEIKLSFIDSSSSCLVRGVNNERDTYVVMPMRL